MSGCARGDQGAATEQDNKLDISEVVEDAEVSVDVSIGTSAANGSDS